LKPAAQDDLTTKTAKIHSDSKLVGLLGLAVAGPGREYKSNPAIVFESGMFSIASSLRFGPPSPPIPPH
jgi:hypothetical protein